jgi:branched-chain amino acid transport system substrate-binding protein
LFVSGPAILYAYNAPEFHASLGQILWVSLPWALGTFMGLAGADKANLGTVLYNRALVNAYYYTEAIRIAQGEFGVKPLTGEQIQWGMDRLDITQATIDKAGMNGLMSPLKITCADHEGGGSAVVQQWDGAKWSAITDFIAPRRDALRPAYEASAAQYAGEKGITPRACN